MVEFLVVVQAVEGSNPSGRPEVYNAFYVCGISHFAGSASYNFNDSIEKL